MNDNHASDIASPDTSATETETTGMPWPKSWTGAYTVVICSFILWLLLLVYLGEFSK